MNNYLPKNWKARSYGYILRNRLSRLKKDKKKTLNVPISTKEIESVI